jgi:hypothetical protein
MLGGADPIPTVAHAAIMALVRPPDAAVSSVLLYLDPGTGSLMVQAAIAAILTVPFIFRIRTRALLRRLRRGPPAERLPDDRDWPS